MNKYFQVWATSQGPTSLISGYSDRRMGREGERLYNLSLHFHDPFFDYFKGFIVGKKIRKSGAREIGQALMCLFVGNPSWIPRTLYGPLSNTRSGLEHSSCDPETKAQTNSTSIKKIE